MYCQFYHLTTPPFQLSAEHDFLWKGRNYLKSFEALKYGLDQHRGLSLLTGEPGSGKTTVIRALLNSLDQTVLAALIPDSSLSVQEFYSLAAHSFSLPGTIDNRDAFQKALLGLLVEAETANKQVLLVIDEAQQLSPEMIEEIDGLLNLKNGDSGRLNICLVGQQNSAQEAGGHLDQAFASHVMVRYLLAPFSQDETCEYIRHRMQAAGADREIFTVDALAAVHRYSGGYPGQINIICDLALYSGFSEKSPEVTPALIQASAEKMQFPLAEATAADEGSRASSASGNERTEDNREQEAEVFSEAEAAAVGGASKRSYAMPALAVLAGVILLGGGYTWYSRQAQKSVPVQTVIADQAPAVEDNDAPVSTLPQKQEDFDAVGYSPPVEDDFAYEQQPVVREESDAGTVADNDENVLSASEAVQTGEKEQRVVEAPVPADKTIGVNALQLEKNFAPEVVSQEGEASAVHKTTVSVDVEPIPAVPVLEPKPEKHIVSPAVSETVPVEAEKDVFPVVQSGSEENVVGQTESKLVTASVSLPAPVTAVQAKEKQPENIAETVELVTDPVASVSEPVTGEESTAAAVDHTVVAEEFTGKDELEDPQAAETLLVKVVDEQPVAGREWEPELKDIKERPGSASEVGKQEKTSRSFPTADEYGAGELSAPVQKKAPVLQNFLQKGELLPEPVVTAAPEPKEKIADEKIKKRKRPTRVATASVQKKTVKLQAKPDPQPEDVIEWLLKKKGKNAQR